MLRRYGNRMMPDSSMSIPDSGVHPDAAPTGNADAGTTMDADVIPDAEPPDWDFGTKSRMSRVT